MHTQRLAAPLALALLAAACGGAQKDAKGAGETDSSAGSGTGDIGEYAKTHGGIRALGGAPTPTMSDADVPGLHAELASAKIVMDGVLGEWPPRLGLRDTVQGSGTVHASVAVQYDAQKLYVGGEIQSDGLVRTDGFGDAEDHLELALAFPTESGRLVPYTLKVYAGKIGDSVGAVKVGRSTVGAAKIVEAPYGSDASATGDYSFEAAIPWSTFPEAARTRVGLRGVARFVKASAPGQVAVVVASDSGGGSDPASMPHMPTEPELAAIEGVLSQNGQGSAAPSFDGLADVGGDAMLERVAVYGRFLVVCGTGYLGGTGYYFRDMAGQLTGIEMRHVSGRAKSDIVLRRKMTTGSATRDWLEVLSVVGDGNGNPAVVFGHEVGVTDGGRTVTDQVAFESKAIKVSIGSAQGWDATSYQEAQSEDVDPILLPWGAVREQRYEFDGDHFAKKKEVANPNAVAPGAAQASSSAPSPPPIRPQEPPTPPVHTAPADLSRQVFSLYLRDRGLPSSTTGRFDVAVNVAGDPRPERVTLVGKDIVVFGPGFKDGASYAYATLSQFADPSDISDMSVRDLTGDGGADVIVKGARRTTPSGSSDPVTMDMYFVYTVKDGAITRVFGAETGREMASKRVQGRLQLVPAPGGHGFDIDLQPGTATGWTEQSYPWSQDQPGGSTEPLLLPWGGIREIRYRWNGTAYAQVS